MIIYSVCYYYGENKKSNIINHLKSFSDIKENKKKFVLTTMIDSRDNKIHTNVVKELSEFIIDFDNNLEYKILTSFNWGGTILGLWMTYNYCKIYNNNNTYISHFEEDFGPKNIDWFNDSKKLIEDEYIYIGESNIGRIKSKNDDNRLTHKGYKKSIRLGNPEVWTDGGYYFSTLEKLKNIEDKIGIFHKGNKNIKYDNTRDGIDLGEVGFPTLLYHKRFKFYILNRNTYFINEW